MASITRLTKTEEVDLVFVHSRISRIDQLIDE
jgi:hypothetical protein